MEEKKSVLIVDDDESTCKTISMIFRKKGFVTEAVVTGREAIEVAQSKFFNIILLDIKLPDILGIKLLKPLKEKHPETKIIVITAHASVKTAIQAVNEGADAYITKPLDIDNIFKKVEELLKKQEKRISVAAKDNIFTSSMLTFEEKTLIKRLIENGINEIKPKIGPNGVIYDLEINSNEIIRSGLLRLLNSLVEKGFINSKEYDRVVFCDNCGNLQFSIKLICPHCQSSQVRRIELVEHQLCGYIGEKRKFISESFPQKNICPKCKIALPLKDNLKNNEKTELNFIGYNFECEKCDSRFEKPNILFICKECGTRYKNGLIGYEKLISYEVPDHVSEILMGAHKELVDDPLLAHTGAL